MIEEDWGEDLKERLIIFLKLLGCLLIDSGFLVAWVAISWTVGKILNYFDGWDPLILHIFEYTLEGSTFIAVFIYIAYDIGIMIKKYINKFNS